MVLEPCLAGSFGAHHARADGDDRRAGGAEEPAVGRIALPGDDLTTLAAGRVVIFAAGTGNTATITGIDAIEAAVDGKAGTRILP